MMIDNPRGPRKFAQVLLACAAVTLFASGCGQEAPADTRSADENTVRELDIKWSAAAAAKDLEQTVSYYSDDASLLPPNSAIVIGKAGIHSTWGALIGSVDSIAWQPNKIEISKSSDMAYVIGVYQMASKDPQGKSVLDHGKYVEVWKKQSDGNWKTVADIFNTDLLPETPGPAAAKKK